MIEQNAGDCRGLQRVAVALLVAAIALVLAALVGVFIAGRASARPSWDVIRQEPRTTRGLLREQLCLADFRWAAWDGGTVPHQLRCALRYDGRVR